METNLSTLNGTKRGELVILILCLLIGFSLRFYTFDQKSLWLDEIHTFNESRDDLSGQLKFYKEYSTHLQPPLFFVLSHLFYPFTKPERDLRIIPLICGTLSIPMIYFLSGMFSPVTALPCALSLTFMAYHISLSQDGRSYAMLMFVGMIGLYFFMKYLRSARKGYLVLVALLYAISFLTSYSSVPFIVFSQILWFYRPSEEAKEPGLSSFLTLNGFLFVFCLPWILFTAMHYKGQVIMDPFHTESAGSFWAILYGILHDWAPHIPLLIASGLLLALFPFLSKYKKNALVLLALFLAPIAGLSLYCELFNVTHFINSRYFISFLPLFFITIYLSVDLLENRFEGLRRFMRLKFLLTVLFIASNLLILPLYYQSEKEDFRGLVNYLKDHLRQGDKLLDIDIAYTPGILHYFGILPQGRLYTVSLHRVSENESELRSVFTYQKRQYVIYCSRSWNDRYTSDGARLWVVAGHHSARSLRSNSHCVLKGYFDGSFLNLRRFPTDAPIYLFLCDPKSPEEKGIDVPIE
jgi:hypothetical protein